MGEPKKFKVETEVPDTTPKPDTKGGNLKTGNEKGVGTDFAERYNQVLESVIKEKFPNYIDPATMNINFNDIKSLEDFNKMNQMKEEILKLVDEKMANGELEKNPTSEFKSVLEFFDAKTNLGEITRDELKQAKIDARNPKFWDEILEEEKIIFTQEDQENYEKLEKEISELEKEISELENLKVAKLEELLEEKKVDEGNLPSEESIPESKKTVTEHLTQEKYKNEIDSIIINKYAKVFEKNHGLQYENTFVTNIKDGVAQKGTIYTEIKFSKGRNSKKFKFLKFELKSQNRVAHLMNERWEVGVFDKISGFNKENAKKISGAIIQDFIKNQKKGNEFKINIEDGDLIMTHQI